MKRLVEAFERRLLRAIEIHQMLQEGERALVAFSAGPDSTALLAALASLARLKGWQLCAIHVDHGLRGKESDADRQAAQALCKILNVPFHCSHLKGFDSKTVSEDALRTARYQAIEDRARRWKCQCVFLGHHAEDLAETLLMHLARGASLEGLVAFAPVESRGPLRLLRPMIDLSRDEILAYLDACNIPFRTDSSNADQRFMRNRIRNQVLPLMEQTLNPGIRQALARTARLLEEDAQCLNELAQEDFSRRVGQKRECQIELDLTQWDEVPAAIRRRVYRQACMIVMKSEGSDFGPYSRHLADIDRLALHGRSRSYVTSIGAVIVYKRRGRLIFAQYDGCERPTRAEVELLVGDV